MKISIITTAKIPHIGGMSTHIQNIHKYLIDNGIDVKLLCVNGSDNTKSGGAQKHSKFIYLISILYKLLISLFLNIKSKADVNIYHDPFSIFFNLVNSKPSILYVHGELANECVALGLCTKDDLFFNIMISIERFAYSRADMIICVDDRLRDHTMGLGFKALSMPNFVKIDSGLNIKKQISCQVFKIVIARRLVEKNGVFYALEALKDLSSFDNVKFKCDIFGGGEYFASLKSNYESKNIIFHGDTDNKIVRGYLRNANIALIPSIPVGDYVEATSISALEAAAESAIVVASNVGGLKQLFSNSDAALLVEPKSSKAILNAILNLFENNKLRLEISRNGYNLIQQNYSIDLYADNLLSIIDGLLNKNS